MSAPQAEAMAEPEKEVPTGTVRVDRDAALVTGLRRGDEDATEHLLDTYGDRVYRLAIRITGNEQDAEEVVQDALWTAARKIDTFKGESAFGSWVYRITANAAYQKLRTRRRAAPVYRARGGLVGEGRGARAADGVTDGADHGHQRSAHGLSNGVSHARCRGALESGDRREPAHQPARREVSCAPLAPGQVIKVERLAKSAGASVEFKQVLLVTKDGQVTAEPQALASAKVTGEVVAEKKGAKVLVVKFKRRKNYRRKRGHRQIMTAVRITKIEA